MRHAVLLLIFMAAVAVMIPLAAATAAKNAEYKLPQHDSALPAVQQSPQINSEDSEISIQPTGQQADLRSIKIYDIAQQKVLELTIGEYIRGAVASEMPASFHQQALNAQAVAAHSWAVYSDELQRLLPDGALEGAAFSVNSEKCEGYMTKQRFFQRYGDNAAMLWPKICAAADYAAGKIVTFEGETALTAYHSASAGETEYSENVWETALPYLVPVKSEGDEFSPYNEVVEKYDKKTMRLLLQQQFPEGDFPDDSPQDWIEILERSDSGYVTAVEVGGVQTHGQQVRTALSLKSGWFKVDYDSGTFSVTTKGYGHGVGMSQYGAEYMAQQGKTAEQILAHYYPGTELTAVS